MRKSISRFFVRLSKLFGEEEVQEVILPKLEPKEEIEQESTKKTDEVEEQPTIVEEKNKIRIRPRNKKKQGEKNKKMEIL